ncbi:choice-of-anchor E domain-containing protein [Duganella qianjiadongensis]|nr:choice-of-anchor E domain-containing protein [Duganella qianjiadongensis]
MKLKTLATAVCIAASTCAVPAMAAVQTFNVSGFSSTATNLLETLNLQKFDGQLGTLTGINITYSADVTGQLLLSNSKALDKTVNTALSSTMQLSLPSEVLGSASHSLLSGPVTATAKTTDVLAGKHTEVLTVNINLASSDFAKFVGAGTLASQLAITATSAANSPTGITADYSTMAKSLGGTITYTYTPAPVPEPETYGMMLLGLGVLAFAGKRKARSAQV